MNATNNPSSFSFRNKFFAHIETWRPYTVIWCGLVSLAGACLIFQDFPPLRTALLVTLIPMMGWIAGLYLSDYLDRNLDLIQKPHRPLPSGRIHPREALAVGGIFAFVGFILSFLLGINNVLLVFLVALLVFSYAKLSKSRGFMGNFNRGFVIIAAYFFGLFSTGEPLRTIPMALWLLALVFFLHDTNSNLVGAIRDIEGDKKGGYITIPVKYGIKKSLVFSLILTFFYISCLIFIIIHYELIFYTLRFSVLFILALLILFVMYLSLLVSFSNIDRKKALRAHEFFIAERITLASAIIIGIVFNITLSVLIFGTAMFVTLLSQWLIRKKYEFVEFA